MTHSDALDQLAAAMSRAQSRMTLAKRDAENPFYGNTYADLAAVRAACLPALTAEGLSVLQFPRLAERPAGLYVALETVILHASGQWMADVLELPITKPDAQAVGSAISYGRRYALAAIAGVAAEGEDDDAERAIARPADGPDRPASVAAVNRRTGELLEPRDLVSPPLTIKTVKEEKTKSGAFRYIVQFSDGKSFSTLNARMRLEAETWAQKGTPVIRELEASGRYMNLKRIAPLDAPPAAVAPSHPLPPDDADIPF